MPTLGTPITAAEANDLISQDFKLKQVLVPLMGATMMKYISVINALNSSNPNDPYHHVVSKLSNHYSDDNNVYIFSKEAFDRFFTGDRTDPNHPNEQAKYLMIIVGSQNSNDVAAGFKEGEPTLTIAGCQDSSPNQDQTEFKILDLANAATEHPPHRKYEVLPSLAANLLVVQLKK